MPKCMFAALCSVLKPVPDVVTRSPHPPIPAAMDDFAKLPYLRMTIAESMRLYPQPPILIRRCAAAAE